MLNKLSDEQIIKGYITDYLLIKNLWKELLFNEKFRWYKTWERRDTFGREGVWLNAVTKHSIRIRWGITYPHAIVYVEKEFVDKVKQFFNKRFYVNGMATPNEDYNILNKGW